MITTGSPDGYQSTLSFNLTVDGIHRLYRKGLGNIVSYLYGDYAVPVEPPGCTAGKIRPRCTQGGKIHGTAVQHRIAILIPGRQNITDITSGCEVHIAWGGKGIITDRTGYERDPKCRIYRTVPHIDTVTSRKSGQI